MNKTVERYIAFIDEIATNQFNKKELYRERRRLKNQLGNCEIPDWEIIWGINFLTKILLTVRRISKGPKN